MKRDKIIKILITILLIQLPFLDMLRTTAFKDIEIFGITLIELVNIMWVGIALILTLTKVKLKEILKLGIYLMVAGLYIYLHYQNIIKFDTNIFPQANFNLITETFYILRVYVLPLMLLYVLLHNKDIFNKEYYFKIIKWIIGIISFSIIVLNIIKLSYISYNSTHNHILYNMFDYFLYQGDYKQLASRGFFDSANELSAILFMLLPINIYLLYKEGKKFNIVLYVAQFLAMVLLGTRTAAFGAAIISVVALGCYGIVILIKKDKINKWFLTTFSIAALACTAYMCISPFMMGRLNDGNYSFAVKDQQAYTDLEEVDEKDIDALINKYKYEYLINEYFLEMYPVSGDKEFWLECAKRDKALNNDSRKMKTDILTRIAERNDNPNDKIFGLGYTLNFIDLERDYYYQYYLFGIAGLLLFIGPYFYLLIKNIIIALMNFKKNVSLKTACCFMSPMLGMLIAYYSGHVFGWVSPMMYLVMFFGLLTYVVYENVKGKEDKNEK